jgi:hypothetical protein
VKRLALVVVCLAAACAGTRPLRTVAPAAFDPPRHLTAATVLETTTTADLARPSTPARASRSRPLPTSASPPGACDAVHAWQPLVACLWGPAAPTAFRVVGCESGGNPNAREPHTGAAGLFQILGGPFDPEANVRRAFAMWQARGWQPWVASQHCWGR